MGDDDSTTPASDADAWVSDSLGVDPAAFAAPDGGGSVSAPGTPSKSPDPAGCSNAVSLWERLFWGDAQDPVFFAAPGAIYLKPDGEFAVLNKSGVDVTLQFTNHVFATDRAVAPAGAEIKIAVNPAAAGTGGTVIAVVSGPGGGKSFQDVVICSGT